MTVGAGGRLALSRIWRLAEPLHVEFAEILLARDSLHASGAAIGAEPVSFRLEYELTTTRGFVTRRLEVRSRGAGWWRGLVLERADSGAWSCTTEAHGELEVSGVGLPSPGGDLGVVQGALDCDLGLSPLTNSMPLLRQQLHQQAGSVEFLMAWVAVPELAVYPSRQRYTYLGSRPEGGALVRFESLDSDFAAEITFDSHGLVVDYPGIGTAIPAAGAREGAH